MDLTDRRANLLLVEDDPLFAMSMQAQLPQEEFWVRVLDSGSGEDFLDFVRLSDIVVLDLALPGQSGFSLLDAIRRCEDTAHIPVLMLTAHSPMSYRLRGLASGADDFMVKPPDWQELRLRLQIQLRRAPERSPVHEFFEPVTKRRVLISESSLVFAEAQSSYTRLHRRDSSTVVTTSISDLEGLLGPRFVRSHRSHIVNLDHVTDGRWITKSDYIVEVDTIPPKTLPVSRKQRHAVSDAISVARELQSPPRPNTSEKASPERLLPEHAEHEQPGP